MPIKHAFTSLVTDDDDPDLVGPDEWNDDHTGGIEVEQSGETPVDDVNHIVFEGMTVTDDTGGQVTVESDFIEQGSADNVVALRSGYSMIQGAAGTHDASIQFVRDTQGYTEVYAGEGDFYSYIGLLATDGSIYFESTRYITFQLDELGDETKFTFLGGNGVVAPSLASDPAGTASEDGQFYYNTTSDTFRARKNGAWGDIGVVSGSIHTVVHGEEFAGDGAEDTFTLANAPLFGVSVYVDGLRMNALTLTGDDIIFDDPPPDEAVILVDYEY